MKVDIFTREQMARSYEQTLGVPTFLYSTLWGNSQSQKVVTADVKKGDRFTDDNVRAIRQGHGRQPRFLTRVLGKRASRDLAYGTPLKRDMVTGL